MMARIIRAATKVVKALAYTVGTFCALFVVLSVWLTLDALTRLDIHPYTPQCLPSPQSFCASTGDEGVRL